MNLRRLLSRLADFVLRRNGFHFSCRGCGDCCRRPGSVYFTLEEKNRFLELYPNTDPTLFQKTGYPEWYEIPCKNSCPFLNKRGRCSVYDARPYQCSSWPFWPENFRTEAEYRNLLRECRGCGSGRYYPAESIKQRNRTNGPLLFPD